MKAIPKITMNKKKVDFWTSSLPQDCEEQLNILECNTQNGNKNMSKSRGIKAASLFVGVLLCMVLMQTAFSQPEGNETIQNATIQNATIQNATIQNAVEALKLAPKIGILI